MSGSQKTFEREHMARLGRHLRQLREDRNWPLKRLSLNSGVSVAAIQKIEAGTINPGLLSIVAIAEALGESVDDLVSSAREQNADSAVVRGTILKEGNGIIDLSPSLVDRRLRCAVAYIAEGQTAAGSQVADAGEPLFGYVLSGGLKLFEGDGGRIEPIGLSCGDAFHVASDATFELRSAKRSTAVLCIADSAVPSPAGSVE